MVVLATAATVIASQAVISGAFSVTRQAVGLGFLPRLTIRHTSRQEIGQVYVPAVNWGIFAAVVALVVGFGSSTGARLRLRHRRHRHARHRHDPVLLRRPRPVEEAAVAGARRRGGLPHRRPRLLRGQPHEGPARRLVPAHHRARRLRRPDDLAAGPRDRRPATAPRRKGPLRAFVDELRAWTRPSTARPAPPSSSTPARRRRRWRCAPTSSTTTRCTSNVVIISIETLKVPNVPEAEQVTIDDLGYRDDGISHVTARLGFQDDDDVPRLLRLAVRQGPRGRLRRRAPPPTSSRA